MSSKPVLCLVMTTRVGAPTPTTESNQKKPQR